MKSVLESKYVPPKRPFSENELSDKRKSFFDALYLSDTVAEHRCGHVYSVKKNSKKQKMILDSSDPNSGNCSVCWNLRKTDPHLQDTASNLVNSFGDNYHDGGKYTFAKFDTEKSYYKWLYLERK